MTIKSPLQSPYHARAAAYSLRAPERQIKLPFSAQSLDWNAPLSLIKILQSAVRKSEISGNGGGIYFLILGHEVVYVGQSANIPARISEHADDPGMAFNLVSVMPCPDNARTYLEPWLIACLSPKFNRTPNRIDIANVHRALVGYARMESAQLRRLYQ